MLLLKVFELCSYYVLLFFSARCVCLEGWGLFRKYCLSSDVCAFWGRREGRREGRTIAAITSLLHAVRKDMKQQVFK